MKIGYFNTRFVFLWCKIQTNIKQNLVEEYVEESQIFKDIFFCFFWIGPDTARSF
jgi:hypothetical protein